MAFLAASCSRGEPSGPTFRTGDGFLLEGKLYGSGDKAVVLAHMFPADQNSWTDFAQELARQGYRVLTFNFRGYGASEGEKKIGVIDRDVSAAVKFMREKQGGRRVVVIGASMGGTAALIAAAKSPIDAVAALSAPAEFMGLDAVSVIAQVPAAKLFIVAKDDPGGALDSADALLRASADVNADLMVIPGQDHGSDMLKGKKASDVMKRLLEFLAEQTK